ncbi:MAG: PQQ-binding-like beta-propeller repeat protein, partial [Phycisphaerales bacterium]|nr:PQQ-binding-like beta-propeller repeat protein [Phycisphaerales bacterium]
MTTLLAATIGASLMGCASHHPRNADVASPGAMNTRSADDGGRPAPAATAPLRTMGYQIEWFVPSALSDGCRFLDPAGDIILVHDGRNVLTAREASTGQRRWGATLATPVAKFVGNMRIDDRIVVSGESEVQYLSARTGDLLDRQRLAALANTPPLHMGRFLIYGCATGEVLGHDMVTGYKKWGHMLEGRITADPVQTGSRAFAVSQTGEIIAIDPDSGRGSRPKRPLYDGLDNSPVADARIAVIAGLDQSIYAFNHSDLSLRWRIRTDAPLKDQPTLANRTAYVAVPTS